MLIKLNEIIVEVPLLPPNQKNWALELKRSLVANKSSKMSEIKRTYKHYLMLTKLNEIIVKISLRATKDIYRPIDFSNVPKTRHCCLHQDFRAMLH